ncbi:HNH endonuclease [Pseudomonas chlororaphis]|uniref:HNH endonuclease n=1 Tax=Pseudomonas chlororaphis TaxID=587753 RepID=UPI0013DDB260|nr:HNH endonuclease [Pseudomonas chlororaphis]
MYKTAQLCQMHYFRVMRNGTTDKLPTSRQQRIITPNGYVRVYEPGHPLADKGGYVFEHRHVMWAEVGPGGRDCELCGKHETWLTCHVDHIDENRQNNARSNLRILCRGCNVKRGFRPESHEFRSSVGLIEFEGRRDTATAWARDPRINVSGSTIRLRKAAGMTDAEALFSDKVTHNGRRKAPAPRKTNHKHERSNAVAITIEGLTMSAAEWARVEGTVVTENTIISRVRSGWDPIEALITPGRKRPYSDEAIKAEYKAKIKELKGEAA